VQNILFHHAEVMMNICIFLVLQKQYNYVYIGWFLLPRLIMNSSLCIFNGRVIEKTYKNECDSMKTFKVNDKLPYYECN